MVDIPLESIISRIDGCTINEIAPRGILTKLPPDPLCQNRMWNLHP
jgi:hypothetical protein